MSDDDFRSGEYVEFLSGPHEGEEAEISDIREGYLELVFLDDAWSDNVAPYYVSFDNPDERVCPLRPKLHPPQSRGRVTIQSELRSHFRPGSIIQGQAASTSTRS